MDFITLSLEKITLSSTLKIAFSNLQNLAIIDCLNDHGKWIRLDITLDFLKKISSNIINFRGQNILYKYQIIGDKIFNVRVGSTRNIPTIYFEEQDGIRNNEM